MYIALSILPKKCHRCMWIQALCLSDDAYRLKNETLNSSVQRQNKHIVFQNNISIIFHKLLNLPAYLFNFLRFILLLILSKMVKKLSKCGTAHDKCCHMLLPHNSIFSLPIWYLCIIPYLWNRKYICTVLARFKISLGKSNIEAKRVNQSPTTATKNKY